MLTTFIWQTYPSYLNPFSRGAVRGDRLLLTHSAVIHDSSKFFEHGMRKRIILKSSGAKNISCTNFQDLFPWDLLSNCSAKQHWVSFLGNMRRFSKMSGCESTRLFTWLCSLIHEKSWPDVSLNSNVLCVTQAGNMLSCFIWNLSSRFGSFSFCSTNSKLKVIVCDSTTLYSE